MSNGEHGAAFLAMCESPDYELVDLVDDGPEDYEPNPYNGDDNDGGAHDHDDDGPEDFEDGEREDDFDAQPPGLLDDCHTDDDLPDYE